MTRYNIETLSFLISSFRDVIQSFGQNSKSVAFYKRQVNQLINIGQVSLIDAELVEELIGMQNTDAVKWDKANAKLGQFINAISTTYGISGDTNKIIAIEQLNRNGAISLNIKELVYRVYGIESKSIELPNSSNKVKFGEIPADKPLGHTSNSNGVTDSNMGAFKRLIASGSKETLVEVRNSEAVCCSDPSYYQCSLSKLAQHEIILRELSKGSAYKIGKPIEVGDSCHPRTEVTDDPELRALADKIHWKSIYNKLKSHRLY